MIDATACYNHTFTMLLTQVLGVSWPLTFKDLNGALTYNLDANDNSVSPMPFTDDIGPADDVLYLHDNSASALLLKFRWVLHRMHQARDNHSATSEFGLSCDTSGNSDANLSQRMPKRRVRYSIYYCAGQGFCLILFHHDAGDHGLHRGF
jgi:hypothetical protein